MILTVWGCDNIALHELVLVYNVLMYFALPFAKSLYIKKKRYLCKHD